MKIIKDILLLVHRAKAIFSFQRMAELILNIELFIVKV